MKNETILLNEHYKYLSDYYSELPSNCILNKGITGCGGTTVEIKADRNSIIVVPTKELVRNKSDGINTYGLFGEIKGNKGIQNYINTKQGYKKIITTYDSLNRVISVLGQSAFTDYFLLIDEYHIFFNYYSLRNKAIREVLSIFNKFNDFCFMTATGLTEETMIEELKHLPIITLDWSEKVPVKVNVIETRFTLKTIELEMYKCLSSDYNLHIFFNSVKSISSIIKKLGIPFDYRIICSSNSQKNLKLNFNHSTDPVSKINFYTAACFEGVDIYDPVGKTIVLSDSNIATTLYDISTLFVQICGRVRDSIYKDEVTFILNPKQNRYAQKPDFNKNIEYGLATIESINNGTELFKNSQLEKLKKDPTLYHDYYVMLENNELKYDDNLRKVDSHNYTIFNKVYNTTLNVLMELDKEPSLEVKDVQLNYNFDTKSELEKVIITGSIYDFDTLSGLLGNILNRKMIEFKRTDVDKYLNVERVRKRVDGKVKQLYKITKIK